MVGVTAYGVYIPRYRLSRKKIFQALGWLDPSNAGLASGEKAVANYDEDSLTMAVAAGYECCISFDKSKLELLLFATTTAPYNERQNAPIIANALGMAETVRTADYTGTTNSGTGALLSAIDSVTSNNVTSALVCSSDSRQGKAGSIQDYLFGDGASALAVGSENVVAKFIGSYSLSCDFPDYRRLSKELYTRTWEERWIRDEGYGIIIPKIIQETLKKYDLNLDEFSCVAIDCPNPRVYKALTNKLQLKSEQLPDLLLDQVGDTGSAYPLMLFSTALEKAKPGDKILLVGYGSGGDSLIFEVTSEIENYKRTKKNNKFLKRRKSLDEYNKYAVFRGKIEAETGIRGESTTFSSLSVYWRERKAILGLEGTRCKKCQTPQYPPQIICINPECRSVDQMEAYIFSNREGMLITYTADNLAFSIDPPAIYGIVDFVGGGRYWFDLTDADVCDLHVGSPVTMSFRRKFYDSQRGVIGYFWKAIPKIDVQEGQ